MFPCVEVIIQIVNNIYIQTEDLSKAEEEQILAKIDEMSLNVQMLEEYLNRHRNVAPERYKMLLNRLQQNPRLEILDKR